MQAVRFICRRFLIPPPPVARRRLALQAGCGGGLLAGGEVVGALAVRALQHADLLAVLPHEVAYAGRFMGPALWDGRGGGGFGRPSIGTRVLVQVDDFDQLAAVDRLGALLGCDELVRAGKVGSSKVQSIHSR